MIALAFVLIWSRSERLHLLGVALAWLVQLLSLGLLGAGI